MNDIHEMTRASSSISDFQTLYSGLPVQALKRELELFAEVGDGMKG